MTAPDALSLSEGAVFHDQYQVVRRIDSGAMGTVYEVLDRRTKRRRALKVMLARFTDNTEVTERFRREATITADIVSEHVVETFDAGVDKATGLPFLVMELLRGEDLGKALRRGPLPASEVVTLLVQAASALDKMHSSGIVHRDLKPENLFITRRDDGAPRLKVLDFGIAKVIEKAAPSATSTRNMGTPVYMSPEQVMGSGNVGPAADLYAVGHLAYTMMTAEAYWLPDALAYETVYPLLLKIMEGVSEAATTRALRQKKVVLPPKFDEWFAKATAHAPEERFHNATASILALADALDVPRPIVASWPMQQGVGLPPTLAPPEGEEDEEAIPLVVPPPPPLPKQEEALRTLSPVSTLPETTPAPPPVRKPARGGYRKVIALGAAFFVTGVAAAVMIARPVRGGAPSAQAASATGGDPPSAGTVNAGGVGGAHEASSGVEPSGPSPSAAPATAMTADPGPSEVVPAAATATTTAAAATVTTTAAAATTPRLYGPKPKPKPKASATPTTPRAGASRTYGDPGRDL